MSASQRKTLSIYDQLELIDLCKTMEYMVNKRLVWFLQHHPNHLYVFTDSSKDNEKTTWAAVLNKTIIRKALPMKSSIFTAKACATDLAFNIISKSKQKKFI